MITNIKLKVTPEQSRKVQEIAFKNGVYWLTNRNVVSYENKPYLYIRRGYISHGTELSTYETAILKKWMQTFSSKLTELELEKY